MTFDNLTDVEFEELCYDFLYELGMQDVSWRKGTGKSSSPADNGRDIECDYCRYDSMFQRIEKEHWFVECKHYAGGVPFDKLQSGLSWASAENPDRLIILASNFLSNPCKTALNNYIRNNAPRFKIEIWERPYIERKIKMYPQLLKKYNIEYRDTFLDELNPVHIAYMKATPYNALDQLFIAMGKFDYQDLNEICSICMISYGYENGNIKCSSNADCVAIIKDKIKSVAKVTSEQFAVQSFIYTVLYMLLPNIDCADADYFVLENEKAIQHSLKNKESIISRMKEICPNEDAEYVTDKFIIDTFHRESEEIKDVVDKTKKWYNEFCDIVLDYLINHNYEEIILNKKNKEE